MTHSYSRLILSFALIALLAACGSNAQLSTSKVTIAVSSGKNASSAPAISKAAPVISSLSLMIIVTAPDMDTITHGPISLASTTSGSVISETIVVPNGNNRTFTAVLADSAGVPAYSGFATADLAGTPISLDISVGPLFLTGTRLIGTNQAESGSAIARDKSGNIFVAGLTYGDLTNPLSSPTSSTSNAFVMKFDISGAPLWTRQFSPSLATTQTPTLSTAAFGAAADANGNVIVVGLTGVNLFETTDYHGSADCFVTKLDGTGRELWTKLIGGAGDDFCNAVTVDNSGNVFVTGQIDSAPTTTAGNNDVLVAKFDPSGNQLWLTQYGTSATDSGTALAVDTTGNTYVVGYTLGTFASNTSAGSEDAFITKLDGAGNIITTNQGGSPDIDMATAISIDNTSGMIYVAGTTYGTVGTPVNSNPIDTTGSSSDIFVVKFDSSLSNPLATWQIGSAGIVSAITGTVVPSNDAAQGIAVDAAGNVFVTGSTNGVFSGNTNAGGYDSVVIKLQPTGTVEWYRQLGTAGDDNGSAIVIDNKGNALVTGTTDGNFDGITGFGMSDVFLMSYDTNGVKY